MSYRRPLLIAISVLLAALLIEAVCYVAARILLPTGLLITQPNAKGYSDYLQARDPVLGWPSPEVFGIGEYDTSGSRVVPAFPDASTESCVALFGDSFTWGDEVASEHAYGNVLAQLMGCRVANYGVGGYGTDQAAIRYMQVIDDDAPIVVLGHFSDNIVRNVNQLRDFIAGGQWGLKPRFVLRGDGLEQVPLPELTGEEYLDVAERSEELLPHEYFRPGTWGAAGVMRMPYAKAVAHAALHYRVVAALRGIRPTYASFYEAGHPSQALAVTVRLLSKAATTATGRGQRFVALLIPDLHDLRAARAGKRTSYMPLREELDAEEIELIDAADYIVARHGDRDFCDLFVTCGNSHFNPDGYRMLAEAVYESLK